MYIQQLTVLDLGSAKEFHNEVGMLLAERQIASSYFVDHFLPLANNKQTLEQLGTEKLNFDKEWAATHTALPDPTPVVPLQVRTREIYQLPACTYSCLISAGGAVGVSGGGIDRRWCGRGGGED